MTRSGGVVAHSTSPTFRADVTDQAGRRLESVGATRTVPVAEGTPADLNAPCGTGLRAQQRSAGPQPAAKQEGSVGTETTTALVRDPARASSGTCR